MDQLLVKSGLFGKGLVPIDTPKAVKMYNEALIDLGIEPTTLTSFRIDGIGWSPEIAAERGDPGYLGHGPANRVAIIVTPDQDRKPIFLPTYSFKRRLMQNFLARSMREIADITQDTCVRLEFENQMLEYQNPKDLLYLDEVTVEASAGLLMEDAAAQRKLVDDFMAPGLGVDNPQEIRQLCRTIIDSAKTHGDLRRRRTEIPPFKFSLIGNFWSRVFGGVFVLRAGADSILIVEDESWLPQIQPEKGERYQVFGIGDRDNIIKCLVEEDMLKLDLKQYRKHPELLGELDTLEHFITIDALCKIDPECDVSAMSVSKQKGVLTTAKNKSLVPPLLADLQKFRRTVSSGVSGKSELRITEALALTLLRPNERLDQDQYQRILWMLLQRLQEDPPDILKLYTHDKERFFALFSTWPDAKKRWAASHISANYVPEMNKI
jgi:hypothetical protein